MYHCYSEAVVHDTHIHTPHLHTPSISHIYTLYLHPYSHPTLHIDTCFCGLPALVEDSSYQTSTAQLCYKMVRFQVGRRSLMGGKPSAGLRHATNIDKIIKPACLPQFLGSVMAVLQG